MIIGASQTLAITARDIKDMAVYSKMLNFIAIWARKGEIKISAITLIIPPMNEYRIPTPSALPASPLSRMGPPSHTVAIEAGVPGILSRIAEIKPPEVLPT